MQRVLSCAYQIAATNGCRMGSSAWNLQFVRWRKKPHRKPFWLGRAKTKLAVFETYPPFLPGEREKILTMMNHYRTMKKSLYNYFKVEFDLNSDTSELGKQRAEAEKREHESLMEDNRLENERVARLREERVANELKATRDYLKQKYDTFEEEEIKRIEEADRLIRLYKLMPVISADTLDAAIDKALETEVDYNFAIDLQGNIYKGKRTRPERNQRNDGDDDDTGNKSEFSSKAL